MGDAFPKYMGDASQYEVHKFMALNSSQVGYFIEQVGLAASSFGVAEADVTYVGNALTMLFDYKCSAATTVIPAQGPQLQSICTTDDCMMAMNATDMCPMAMEPGVANATLAMGLGNMTSTATMVDSGSPAASTAGSGMGGSSASGSAPISTDVSAGVANAVGTFSLAGMLAGAIAFVL